MLLGTLAPMIFAELFPKEICKCWNLLECAMILVFLGVLFRALMKCTLCAMPEYFSLNTGMMFGAMLAASDTVSSARRHEGDRRGRQGDHDHHILLFAPFYAVALEDETFRAGELR